MDSLFVLMGFDTTELAGIVEFRTGIRSKYVTRTCFFLTGNNLMNLLKPTALYCLHFELRTQPMEHIHHLTLQLIAGQKPRRDNMQIY